ncbi:MAG: glucosamine-6-phosphate deaminase [Halanaerobiales bacterium]|nr:glucosamine-6-phosphate deaminase [Halanaerobiales bacterium]
MNVITLNDYEELSKKAARILAGKIELKPDSVLGLPTGGTPLGMYKRLVEYYQKENISFNKITTFNLDEYIDIKPDHPASFNKYMYENLFKHVDIKEENIHIPKGNAEDIQAECIRYEKEISQAGGIDLLVLGIGENGHLAFLEPSDSIPVWTSVVKLSEHTRIANSSDFENIEMVPKKAITMGIKTILSAENIILLASGKNKAWAVEQMIKKDITPQIPATFVKLHEKATILLDKEAAANI